MNPIQRVNRAVRDALLGGGLRVTKATPHSQLLKLITSLRPQDCGLPLIRIGGEADGGYLLPDDLEGIEYCFSPGVNTVADFKNHLADLRIKSFLVDYSVDGPPIKRAEFTFDKKFVGSEESDKFFTLGSWKDKYLSGYEGDLKLQMDIEGSEQDVISHSLSYSLYLWQQPFFCWASRHKIQTFPLNFVATPGLAALSYSIVERPITRFYNKNFATRVHAHRPHLHRQLLIESSAIRLDKQGASTKGIAVALKLLRSQTT